MNFKEVIELILTTSASAMTSEEIADAINDRKLYLDWKGRPVNSGLVYGRATQHLNTFAISAQQIRLINSKSGKELLLRHLRNLVTHFNLKNSEVIIPFLIFWSFQTEDRKTVPNRYFGSFNFGIFSEIKSHDEQNEYWTKALQFFYDSFRAETNINLGYLHYELELTKEYDEVIRAIRYSGIREESLSQFELGQWFIDVIITIEQHRGKFSEIVSSRTLIHLFERILSGKKYNKVYDPFSGYAGLINSIINRDTYVVLQEINPKIALVAWMNMILNGFSNFKVYLGNSITHYVDDRFDLIITDPPYGLKYPKDFYEHLDYLFVRDNLQLESVVIQLIIGKLSQNGKAIIPVTDNILHSSRHTTLRKYLVDNDLIHTIISLPTSISNPNSGVKLNLLIIDKNKTGNRKDFLLFQELDDNDLTFLNVLTLIDNWDEIPSNSQILHLSEIKNEIHYTLNARKVVQSRKFSSQTYFDLKSLLRSQRSGTRENELLAIKKEYVIEGNSIPLISIRDLSDSAANNVLRIDNVDKYLILDENLNVERNVISQEAILVAKIGAKLKPTYHDGRYPIALTSNVLALYPNSSLILSEYLMSQLNEEYVLMQIEQIRKGTAQLYFSVKDLLDIKIRVESLNIQEQEKFLRQFYKEGLNKAELIIKDEEKKLGQQEITIMSSLQHELRGQVLQPLVQEIGNLKNYLDNKSKTKEGFDWANRIINRPGSRTVSEVFTHLDDVIETANKLFDNMQSIIELDKTKMTFEKVNLQSFIKSRIDEFGEKLSDFIINYSFDFHGKSQLTCELDIDLFSNVISNFVRNSIEHGFDETFKEKHIIFNVQKAPESSELILDMLDNGRGLSDDFNLHDYVSFGTKSGSSGSGIGGYLINRTIEIHGGKIEMVDTRKNNNISIPSVKNYPFINSARKIERKEIIIKPGVHIKIVIPISRKI